MNTALSLQLRTRPSFYMPRAAPLTLNDVFDPMYPSRTRQIDAASTLVRCLTIPSETITFRMLQPIERTWNEEQLEIAAAVVEEA